MRKAIGAVVRPARLPATKPVEQAGAHFVRPRIDLRSLALVYRGPRAAAAALKKLTRSLRKLPAGRVPVGAGGRAIRTKQGVLVVWRRDRAVGAILLSGPYTPKGLRGLAIDYASSRTGGCSRS